MPGNDKTVDELKQHWPVLVACLFSYVAIAASWSFVVALTLKDITEEFGVSIGTFSSVVGVFLLVKTSLHATVSGPLTTLYGPHKLANLAILCIGFVDLAAGFCWSSATLLFCLGLNYLLSSFCDQPTYIALASQYFDSRLPFATAVFASGYSAAGFLAPLVAGPLLIAFSWRAVWWAIAAFALVLTPISMVIVKPGPRQLHVTSGSSSLAATCATSFGTVAVQPSFWILQATCICVMVYGGMISAHLPTLLRTDGGLDAIHASTLYSFQYFAAVLGKLMVGLVLNHVPRALLFTVPPVIFAASHLLLVDVELAQCLTPPPVAADTLSLLPSLDITAWVECQKMTQDPTRLAAYCATVGLSFGFTFSLLTCQPQQLYSRALLPTVQSITFAALTLGLTLGNSLIGIVRDRYDTYRGALVITFGSSVAAVLLCVLLIFVPLARQETELI